jgi:hypothetical protein
MNTRHYKTVWSKLRKVLKYLTKHCLKSSEYNAPCISTKTQVTDTHRLQPMQSQCLSPRPSVPVPSPLATGYCFQQLFCFSSHRCALQLFSLTLEGTGGDPLHFTVQIVLVPLQIRCLGKGLGAGATHKRLFLSVSPLMVLEVGLVLKALSHMWHPNGLSLL